MEDLRVEVGTREVVPAGGSTRVLVVDDEPETARATRRVLVTEGMFVAVESDPAQALNRLERGDLWDVVLLDVGMPGLTGLDLLRRHQTLGWMSSVVMLTADNTAGTAAACLRAGAFNYLTKPARADDVTAVVQSAARHTALRRLLAAAERRDLDFMVGCSPALHRVQAAIDRLAQSSVSVMIYGESGTGKELVARALHAASPRRDRPFVAINCGAVPEGLIDSELFGHERGAFTGATAARAGVFVEADGGTLFLDEIGEMPPPVQARLLRVLQEGEIRAVGGSGIRTVDVRMLAATHADLGQAVEQGRFRQDLYFRLDVVALALPPLRERLEDLPMLVAHFLKKHGGDRRLVPSSSALEAMMRYPWPGNIRELENAVLHSIALTQGDVLDLDALPQRVRDRDIVTPSIGIEDIGVDGGVPLTEAKRRVSHDFERRYLLRVLERAKGSIAEAARLSGVDRTNFRRLLHRHGIDATRFKS